MALRHKQDIEIHYVEINNLDVYVEKGPKDVVSHSYEC
jgi:hypothetical protein